MLWGDWSSRFSGRSEKRVKPQGGKNSQYYYDSDYTCWQLNENAQHCTEGHCKKSRAAAAAAAVFRFFMVAADLARLVCKLSKKGTHKIIERLRGVCRFRMLWGVWSTRFSRRSEKRTWAAMGGNLQYYYHAGKWMKMHNTARKGIAKSRAAAAAAGVCRFFMVTADLIRLVCKFLKMGP